MYSLETPAYTITMAKGRSRFSRDQSRLAEAIDQMFAIFGTEFSKFVQRQQHVAAKAFTKPLQRLSHHVLSFIDLTCLSESRDQRVVNLSEIRNRMPQLACRRDRRGI